MRVGILTFHFAYNYGAVFQTWALMQYLMSKGHQAVIVNYDPRRRRFPWWVSDLAHGKMKLFWQHFKFRAFRYRYLDETPSVRVVSDLERLRLDAIVVGSDQVWNVRFFADSEGKHNPMFFLRDLTQDVRRVAYAASVGDGGWNAYKWKDELQVDIRAFGSCSVRESFARDELLGLGVCAPCVPDPTLLIPREMYDRIAPRRNASPYVFAYLLTERDAAAEICAAAQKALSCPLRSVALNVRECRMSLVPSPRQWLRLLRESRFVVTDSFHGVALSVTFNVPFVALLKPNKPGPNARIRELLERVGLEDRIVTPTALQQDIFRLPIDWPSVNEKVELFRRQGESFLREALHGE